MYVVRCRAGVHILLDLGGYGFIVLLEKLQRVLQVQSQATHMNILFTLHVRFSRSHVCADVQSSSLHTSTIFFFRDRQVLFDFSVPIQVSGGDQRMASFGLR